MSCEHLICAQCASPVVEARCPACQAARAEVHHHHFSGLTPRLTVAVLVVLVLLTLILQLTH
jgi:hypothetical protein